MRKLIYGINVSLDGCCDHTKMNGDESVHNFFTQLLKQSDALLYGRTTFELMVPFWPDMAKAKNAPTKSMSDFAQAFDDVKKIVVFSKSLKGSDNKNVTVLSSNLQEEVLKLKKENGKDILMGGVDLASQIVQLGLVDEYYIVVHPVIAGEGRRLFSEMNMQKNLQLKLAETTPLKSGNVVLHYVKA